MHTHTYIHTYILILIFPAYLIILPSVVAYHIIREVLWHLISSEGLHGLSKGFSLNIVKGPVALSISLTVYDLLRKRLQDPHIRVSDCACATNSTTNSTTTTTTTSSGTDYKQGRTLSKANKDSSSDP